MHAGPAAGVFFGLALDFDRGRTLAEELARTPACWWTLPALLAGALALGRARGLDGWAAWIHKVAAASFGWLAIGGMIAGQAAHRPLETLDLFYLFLVGITLPLAVPSLWPHTDDAAAAVDAPSGPPSSTP